MKISNLHIIFWAVAMPLLLSACNKESSGADAYGNFEATEYTISAEIPGKLIHLDIEEGAVLEAGAQIGLVDTVQLHLKKQQAFAEKAAIATQTRGVLAQMAVIREELSVLGTEKTRLENLIRDSAATTQSLDAVDGKMRISKSRLRSIETQNAPVIAKLSAVDKQVALLDDQILRCRIINPVKGTVLHQFAYAAELTSPGRPLYRLAPMDHLYLRAYLSGAQLSTVKLGQTVSVRIDNPDENRTDFSGEITWIAQKAEFTPKIVQTKETRTNLVYAFKIKVKNDGRLKLGMPAEVYFGSKPQAEISAK